MTVATPTIADLKAAYPEFTAVADGVLQNALNEAATVVDSSWDDAVFPLAYMLYAAHVLVLGGNGTGSQAKLQAEMPFGVKRRRAGDTEIEVFQTAPGGGVTFGSSAWYQQTPYGARFFLMQRRQFAGPRVYPSPIQDRARGPFCP